MLRPPSLSYRSRPPSYPGHLSRHPSPPIHLWMVTGNPFLEEQTMLGSREEPIPMSRIF